MLAIPLQVRSRLAPQPAEVDGMLDAECGGDGVAALVGHEWQLVVDLGSSYNNQTTKFSFLGQIFRILNRLPTCYIFTQMVINFLHKIIDRI